ncbi:MAG TPA: azurin [Flavobacterium sp.]|nr:azurin [Flavobacterium sp.]
MKKTIKTFVFLFLVTATVACKNDTKKTESTIEYPETSEQATAPENDNTTVVLEGNDQMQFDKSEIDVPVGKTISLTLKHTGKLAKEVMGHNFVLLDQGVDFNDFASKAVLAKETDYIPADATGVLAHTKVIGGGESVTVEFTISEAGTYDFLCSFPGHSAMMKGKLIAK